MVEKGPKARLEVRSGRRTTDVMGIGVVLSGEILLEGRDLGFEIIRR